MPEPEKSLTPHEDEAKLVAEATEQRNYGGLRQVEIFRTGTHNTDRYTVADLDAMVSAFGKVGFNVPVKLGHFEPSGERAFGWVENLRRKGSKLVADFMDMPDGLVALVKERAFEHVSAEVFFDLERNGKKFRRVLKAVALLGAETPAVSGLKPLHTVDIFSDDDATVHAYEFAIEEPDMAEAPKTPPTDKSAARIAALEAERDELKSAVTDATDQIKTLKSDTETAKVSAIEVKELREQIAELKTENKEAAEARRLAEIQSKMSNFTWPALADHFSALYDAASSQPSRKVKFFTVDKEGSRIASDEPLMAVVDDLRKRLEKSTKLLMEQRTVPGAHGDLRPADAPQTAHSAGDELNDLVTAYRANHPEIGYEAAMDKVMADPDNRDLIQRYVAGQ